SPEDVVKVGDKLEVKLIGFDDKTGKLKLSRRALLPKPEGYVEQPRRTDYPRKTDSRRRNDDRRDRRR
ncbi:MAG: S1 RNA-binding domain-containing protein, partial [Prolixibacteraceae bacterium]|nr:S1 RNA-binding domain-containing protein [Prolixibacteraceae bacterium]